MSEQRAQLVEELKALLQQDVMAVKDQVDHLKQQFYRAESDAAEAAEEATEVAVEVKDELEEQFKALLNEYKAKRAEVAAELAKEQAENLKKKQAILDVMKTLAEAETADVMDNLKRMRELQAEWKAVGPVPAEKVQELRKAYQQYQEQFYDLVKINIELRDLDFKKNLEMKTLLCEAAERLQNNENIVEASRALQQLHDEWAEIGPVARELREELWNRFKAASTTINKKHQDYFDRLHAKEKENLEAKQELIERLKVIVEPVTAEDANLSTKKWEEASAQVQAIQAEWRTIGFAPRKFNQAVYEEFRALCDAFYKAKTAHFKGIREELNANLGKKRNLVDRARELAEQTRKALAEQEIIDWNATADAFRDMQAEWKKVGPIARKYSEDLWLQFSEACDTFFNAKRENAQAQRAERADQRRRKEGGLSINKMRENLRQEIKTAENNILFFTAKSKTANKLVDDMQKKIELLKKRLQELENEMDE